MKFPLKDYAILTTCWSAALGVFFYLIAGFNIEGFIIGCSAGLILSVVAGVMTLLHVMEAKR